jgi:hypothetical protein
VNRWLLLIAPFFLLACADENFLQVNLGAEVIGLKPNYSNAKRFVSNTGDTIEIRQISSQNTFERQTNNLPNGQGATDIDVIKLERQKLIVGSDTPNFRFQFNLEAQYAPNSPRLGIDNYALVFTDENNEVTRLDFEFVDSLQCLSPRCAFTDTLKLLNRTFLNCYYTARDSLNSPALYLNSTQGLIGFKSGSNQIFELIN